MKRGKRAIRTYKKSFKDIITQVDPVLFFCTLAISGVSLLTLISGREAFGMRRIIMQAAMTLVGTVITFVIANLDYQEIVEKTYIFMFFGSVIFLASVLLFGVAEGENKSWITVVDIGGITISIQPSEFVKASFMVSFAKHLSTVKGRINNPKSILGLAIHAGVIVGLILISGDLGVSLVYIGIIAVMLFCAGMSGWYFAGAVGVVSLAAPFLWDRLATYQKARILAGFDPDSDPLGYGLHQIQCRAAISNGGFFGKGTSGSSSYKSLFAADTDCIFATFCEMFGFFGGVLLIAIYAVIIIRIIYIARTARKDYGAFICAGVAGMMIIQTVENIGMNLCMLPVIGITLPFMSAGGSSVLAIYIIFGMVHSVYAHRIKYYSERRQIRL